MSENANGSASTSAVPTASELVQTRDAADMMNILQSLMKGQTGEVMSHERMAQVLVTNMSTLVKQGKLNQNQILQLKQFVDKHSMTAVSNKLAHSALKATLEPGTQAPILSSHNPADGYPPISQTLNSTNPGPVPWTPTRPTLSGGIAAGRMSGTPAQIARPAEDINLTVDDNRVRRKNTPGDQSMRRTIQDLVYSVDPNVKIEPEVEDLLLSIADEFIDSVTNFSCRLAKHRGGDTLEVRDLQLHLERNHNIRIPGFSSDETRISLSQPTVVAPAAPAATKKGSQGTHMTLRSQRLAQVQQAKREAKLM